MILIFLHKRQSFQEVGFNFLVIKVSYKGIISLFIDIHDQYSQITQSKKVALSF